MTERLHFHFSLSCTGEGNGNPLQCSCLENPSDGGAWQAAVYGVAQSRTRLKQLSSIRCNSWMLMGPCPCHSISITITLPFLPSDCSSLLLPSWSDCAPAGFTSSVSHHCIQTETQSPLLLGSFPLPSLIRSRQNEFFVCVSVLFIHEPFKSKGKKNISVGIEL